MHTREERNKEINSTAINVGEKKKPDHDADGSRQRRNRYRHDSQEAGRKI